MRKESMEIQNTDEAMDEFLSYFAEEVMPPVFPSKDYADMVESLLNEALLNAWEHGNRKDPEKRILVGWRCMEGGGMEISVKDEGSGFTPLPGTGIPPLSQRRGRGILILREFADSVRFNQRGNEITFTCKGEKTMDQKYFKGFLIVLGLDVKESNAREEIRILRENMVKLTTDMDLLKREKEVFILINMSPFNVVSSTFFGDIGAILDVDQIKMMGLCGMQPTVKKIAMRMGVIEGESLGVPTPNIEENLYKIKAFESISEGFASLLQY